MGIEFLRNEGLLHVVVDAQTIAGLHIVGRGEGRGEDDDHIAIGLADAFHHLEAVHHGHVDVGDDDVGMRLLPGLHTFLAILGGGYLVAAYDVFQTSLLDVSQRFIVFY